MTCIVTRAIKLDDGRSACKVPRVTWPGS